MCAATGLPVDASGGALADNREMPSGKQERGSLPKASALERNRRRSDYASQFHSNFSRGRRAMVGILFAPIMAVFESSLVFKPGGRPLQRAFSLPVEGAVLGIFNSSHHAITPGMVAWAPTSKYRASGKKLTRRIEKPPSAQLINFFLATLAAAL